MKKSPLSHLGFAFFIFVTMCFMNCEQTETQPEEKIPENVFVGKAWEWSTNDINDFIQIKISFYETSFSVYHKIERVNYEETFTGTYSLFYEELIEPPLDPYYEERIRFISEEPTLNGTARYDFPPNGIVHFSTKSGNLTYGNKSGTAIFNQDLTPVSD